MVRALQLVTTRRPFFEEQVRALERLGVECTVVSVPGEGGSRGPSQYLRFYGRVLRAVDDHDLVHANYGLTAPAALAQPIRPTVLSLWGSDLLGTAGPASRALARAFDAVVVASEAMAGHLDGSCRVVPHGVDLDRFAPAPQSAARQSVGWTDRGHHVLFPYDPDRTVKDFPRARRVVAAARERLDDPVRLHVVYGADHDRLPAFMNAADALLLTSRREGSPNAVKEALACRLPVVATPVGDVPAMLADVSGTLVGSGDPALVDGLTAVLRRGERADSLARAGEYALEATTRRLCEVYAEALDRPHVADGVAPEVAAP